MSKRKSAYAEAKRLASMNLSDIDATAYLVNNFPSLFSADALTLFKRAKGKRK